MGTIDGGDPDPDTDHFSHFPQHVGDSLAFLIVTGEQIFTKLGETTDANKRIKSLYFGSDTADTWT